MFECSLTGTLSRVSGIYPCYVRRYNLAPSLIVHALILESRYCDKVVTRDFNWRQLSVNTVNADLDISSLIRSIIPTYSKTPN